MSSASERLTIFGIPLGHKPAGKPQLCGNVSKKSADAPYCIEELTTGLNFLVDEIGKGLGAEPDLYEQLGLKQVNLWLNENTFDTSIFPRLRPGDPATTLSLVAVTFDKKKIVQQIIIKTRFGVHKQVMEMLSRKFGKPTDQGIAEWTDTQTGAVVAKMPRASWIYPDVIVEYESRSPDQTNNSQDQDYLGRIVISTPSIAQQIKAKSAPATKQPSTPKRGM